MMNCIAKFVSSGKITQELGDELLSSMKKGKTVDESFAFVKETVTKKRREHPHQKVLDDLMEEFKMNEKDSISTQIKQRLTRTPGEGKTFHNAEDLSESYDHAVFSTHYETLNKFRNKLFGNKLKKGLLDDMIQALFKEPTSKDGVEALEEFRTMYKTSQDFYENSGGKGGDTPILLTNNAERILQDDMETFLANTRPLVKNSDEEIKDLYNKAHTAEEIESMQFDFTSAENYKKYASIYGNDVFSSLISQIKLKNKQTALNKIFGSKGNINRLIKQNNLNISEQRQLDNIVNEFLGETGRNVATGKMATVSKIAKAGRMLAAASQLGSAVLSAVSDIATALITGDFNGLPIISTFFKLINGLAHIEENAKTLAKQGFIADNLINDLAGATRMDVHAGTDVLSIATDKVLRASGLMAWTNGIKNAWKLAHLDHLATLGDDISKMSTKEQAQFKRYGITQDVWDNVNVTNGNIDLSKTDVNTAHIIRKYINGEASYAVVEPGVLVRAMLNQGTQSGTLSGEALRTVTQYKSFAVASYMTHVMRVLKLDKPMHKAEYAAKMIVAGTALGVISQGLKDGANGKDPFSRDYTTPKAFAEAFVTSGIGGPAVDSLVKGFEGGNGLELLNLSVAPALALPAKIFKDARKGIMGDKDMEETFSAMLTDIGHSIPGQNVFYAKYIAKEVGRAAILIQNPEYKATFDRIDRAQKRRDAKSGVEDIPFFD